MSEIDRHTPTGWLLRRSTGPAAEFHHRPVPSDRHEIWIHSVAKPALVLGSTQPAEIARRRSASALATPGTSEIEIAERRSGGGLVYVHPEDCWVDLIVPRASPLWIDDIGRSFHWVGQLLAEALGATLGPAAHVEIASGPARRWRRPLLCFAEVGHGEVLVRTNPDAAETYKAVGLSQRRTRGVSRFQSLTIERWRGPDFADLVDLETARRRGFEGPGPRDEVLAGLPPPLQGSIQGFSERIAGNVIAGLPTVAPSHHTG